MVFAVFQGDAAAQRLGDLAADCQAQTRAPAHVAGRKRFVQAGGQFGADAGPLSLMVRAAQESSLTRRTLSAPPRGLCLIALCSRLRASSRGSTEHIAAAMIAREVGVDPSKINYVAFRGGGEAIAAILGGNVTIGGSGYSEFAEYIASGKMRPLAVTSATRLKGVNVPTLKEQDINVVIGNWRGVYGAPGITAAQRKELTDRVLKALKSKAWAEALEKNNWTPAVLTGADFEKFVDDDFASLRATMVKSGMV